MLHRHGNMSHIALLSSTFIDNSRKTLWTEAISLQNLLVPTANLLSGYEQGLRLMVLMAYLQGKLPLLPFRKSTDDT